MKITIVEYINEYGEYNFYRAYKTISPLEAVKRYFAENNIVMSISALDDDEVYAQDYCRAYRVTLTE